MSTSPNKLKRAIKKPKTVESNRLNLPQLDLASVTGTVVILHSVDFNLNITAGDEKFSHNLACIIRNVISGETQNVGFCDFSIERILDGNTVAEMKASYIYIIVSDQINTEETRRASIEHFAKLSLWPRFKNLFGMINLQSDADFPKLPMNIPSVAFQDVSNPSG